MVQKGCYKKSGGLGVNEAHIGIMSEDRRTGRRGATAEDTVVPDGNAIACVKKIRL